MSFIKPSSQFCLFCYKTFDKTTTTVETPDDIKKFLKLLIRFVNCQKIKEDEDTSRIFAIDKFVKLANCGSCREIINEFCEIYHQIKLLGLQLDLKLNKLVERIDHANKVPTRWMALNKILEESFQSDLSKQAECQKLIRSFRQNVIKEVDKRKFNSQPRVLLTRSDSTSITSISREPNASVEKIRNTIELEDLHNNSDNDYSSEQKSFRIRKTRRPKNPEFDLIKLRRENPDMTCQKCGKQLKSFRGLFVHLEYHKDPNEWKFECEKCGRKCATVNNLNTHMRSHTGDKPFACKFCSIKYSYKMGLMLHLNECHKNEKGSEVELSKRLSWRSGGILTNFQKNRNTSKNICQKYKPKGLMRQKGSTQLVSIQNGKNEMEKIPQSQRQVNRTINVNLVSTEFSCRYCDLKYLYQKGLRRHLQDKHMNEVDVQDELRRNYRREKISDEKFLTVEKGSTKVVYFQNSGKIDNDAECFEEDDKSMDVGVNCSESLNGPLVVLENDDGLRDMEAEPIVVPGNENILDDVDKFRSHEDDDINKEPSATSAVFMDPQIQIKQEHLSVLYDYDNSKEHSSEKEEASSNLDIPTGNQNPSRYSLREKRSPKFADFMDINDPEYFDNDEDIYLQENELQHSSDRKIESEVGTQHVKNPVSSKPSTKKERSSSTVILKCEICSRTFTSFLRKDYHFKIHHDLSQSKTGKIVKCKKVGCTAYFLSSEQLKTHAKQEHSVKTKIQGSKQNRFVCTKCGKGFPTNCRFLLHLEYHKDPSEWKWECGVCGKKSASKYKLQEHMRRHTNERPFKCRFCREMFRGDGDLRKHLILKHSDEKDVNVMFKNRQDKITNSKQLSQHYSLNIDGGKEGESLSVELSSKPSSQSHMIKDLNIYTEINRCKVGINMNKRLMDDEAIDIKIETVADVGHNKSLGIGESDNEYGNFDKTEKSIEMAR